MLDTITKLKPSELAFDIRNEDMEGAGSSVGVFFHTLDEDHQYADNLGNHNVDGLPEYFGPEDSECYWSFPGGVLDQIKADLEAAGFTYVPLDSDMGEDDEDANIPPQINPERCALAGYIDVDAGSIWIGDGCYVLKDNDEPRPKDLGDDWHGICERFFTRSGYYDMNREFQRWARQRDKFMFESAEWKEWFDKYRGHADCNKHGTEVCNLKEAAMKAAYERFEKDNPFVPTVRDKGFAVFNHSAGHPGMGIMMSTYYGDGSYPVYIEYDKHKSRPRRVIIDFDPGNWDDEDE